MARQPQVRYDFTKDPPPAGGALALEVDLNDKRAVGIARNVMQLLQACYTALSGPLPAGPTQATAAPANGFASYDLAVAPAATDLVDKLKALDQATVARIKDHCYAILSTLAPALRPKAPPRDPNAPAEPSEECIAALAKNTDLTKEIADAQAALAAKTQAIASAEEGKRRCDVDLMEKTKNYDALAASLQAANQKTEECNAKLRAETERVATLKRDLSANQEKIAGLEREKVWLTSQIGEFEGRNAELTGQIRSLNEQMLKLGEDIRILEETKDSLTSELQNKEKANTALQAQLASVQEEIAAKQKQLQAQLERAEGLEGKLQENQAELATLNTRLADNKRIIDSLTEQNQKLQSGMDALATEKNALTAQNQELSTKLTTTQEEITKLQGKVQELRTTADAAVASAAASKGANEGVIAALSAQLKALNKRSETVGGAEFNRELYKIAEQYQASPFFPQLGEALIRRLYPFIGALARAGATPPTMASLKEMIDLDATIQSAEPFIYQKYEQLPKTKDPVEFIQGTLGIFITNLQGKRQFVGTIEDLKKQLNDSIEQYNGIIERLKTQDLNTALEGPGELFARIGRLFTGYLDLEDRLNAVRIVINLRTKFLNDGPANQNAAKNYEKLTNVADMTKGLEYQQIGYGGSNYGPFYKVVSGTNGVPEMVNADLNKMFNSSDRQHLIYSAYGFSGSGKTFTLVGDKDSSVLQTIIRYLNDKDNKERIQSIDVIISDIYGEITENGCLSDYKTDRPTLETLESTVFYYKNGGLERDKTDDMKRTHIISYKEAESNRNKIRRYKPDEIGTVLDYYNAVNEERKRDLAGGDQPTQYHIRATPNNPESSRSHLFIDMFVNYKTGGAKDMDHITIVDLGGSEKVDVIQDNYFETENVDALKFKYEIITQAELDELKPNDVSRYRTLDQIDKDIKKIYNTTIDKTHVYGNNLIKNVNNKEFILNDTKDKEGEITRINKLVQNSVDNSFITIGSKISLVQSKDQKWLELYDTIKDDNILEFILFNNYVNVVYPIYVLKKLINNIHNLIKDQLDFVFNFNTIIKNLNSYDISAYDNPNRAGNIAFFVLMIMWYNQKIYTKIKNVVNAKIESVLDNTLNILLNQQITNINNSSFVKIIASSNNVNDYKIRTRYFNFDDLEESTDKINIYQNNLLTYVKTKQYTRFIIKKENNKNIIKVFYDSDVMSGVIKFEKSIADIKDSHNIFFEFKDRKKLKDTKTKGSITAVLIPNQQTIFPIAYKEIVNIDFNDTYISDVMNLISIDENSIINHESLSKKFKEKLKYYQQAFENGEIENAKKKFDDIIKKYHCPLRFQGNYINSSLQDLERFVRFVANPSDEPCEGNTGIINKLYTAIPTVVPDGDKKRFPTYRFERDTGVNTKFVLMTNARLDFAPEETPKEDYRFKNYREALRDTLGYAHCINPFSANKAAICGPASTAIGGAAAAAVAGEMLGGAATSRSGIFGIVSVIALIGSLYATDALARKGGSFAAFGRLAPAGAIAAFYTAISFVLLVPTGVMPPAAFGIYIGSLLVFSAGLYAIWYYNPNTRADYASVFLIAWFISLWAGLFALA